MSNPIKEMEELFVELDNYENLSGVSDIEIVLRNSIFELQYWEKILPFISNKSSFQNFFRCLNGDDRVDYFGFGIECFLNFLQANFTGPKLPQTVLDVFTKDIFAKHNYQKLLTINNEEINCNTILPILLLTAKYIFKYCNVSLFLNLSWQRRAIIVHQQILEDLSPELFREAEQIDKSMKDLQLSDKKLIQYHIEQARVYHLFRNIHNSESHVKAAKTLLQINVELISKLGKRTKFQVNSLPQLTLKVEFSNKMNEAIIDSSNIEIPQNLALHDDLRLDKINFEEPEEIVILPDSEQKLLLAMVEQKLMTNPQDGLYIEEIQPYISFLLEQKNCWSVRAVTLLLRSKLEAKNKHTVERCLMQCEEILNCIKGENPHVLYRLSGMFATNLKPIWKVEAELAEIMLKLGLVKTSLEIYLRLQLWEEVIVCYTLLNQRQKAAEIIKQELEKCPTIKLWCLLGDATDDVSCYEKAWEISNKTSSRAQRHWGQYFYVRKQYKECIPHFEKSLSINFLQESVWLRYGFAALKTENWSVAALAYKRYTSLEMGNFEVWNNLAKAYIKLNNKNAAYKALHEAIKCNFENWMVWDNLMVVSVDIGNYHDVVNAYNKILDMKQKHLDTEVLCALVYGISNNKNNSKNDDVLMKKTRELLGRITSIYPNEGKVWELYAQITPDLYQKAQRLQRSLTGYMQPGWNKDINTAKVVLNIAHKFGESVLDKSIEPEDTLVNSARRNLNVVISAILKQNFDELYNSLYEVKGIFESVLIKLKIEKPDHKDE